MQLHGINTPWAGANQRQGVIRPPVEQQRPRGLVVIHHLGVLAEARQRFVRALRVARQSLVSRQQTENVRIIAAHGRLGRTLGEFLPISLIEQDGMEQLLVLGFLGSLAGLFEIAL